MNIFLNLIAIYIYVAQLHLGDILMKNWKKQVVNVTIFKRNFISMVDMLFSNVIEHNFYILKRIPGYCPVLSERRF